MTLSSSTEHRRAARRHRTARCPRRGSVFLNNRHYDSTTGVFISVDPIVEALLSSGGFEVWFRGF